MSTNSSSRVGLAWTAITAVLALTLWFGWKALRDTQPADADGGGQGGRPPSTVIVRPLEEKLVVEHLSVTGSLRAVRRAEVASRESAAVKGLEVDEGDLITAGTVIAQLDSRRLEAQRQEASASMTAAKADLVQREAEAERADRDEEMMRALWDQRAVAEREYLDSVREKKVAEARVNAADEAIEVARKRLELLEVRFSDLEIRAPFAGRVVALHTELGEWLNEGDPVVTLVSVGEVEAWLELPERHAALLRQTSPDSVEIRLPGRPDSIAADRISLIPDVEGRSRRFKMIAHIPDPENRLTAGLSVVARVPLGAPSKRLVISTDAILKSYSGNHVFVPQPAGDGPPIAKRVPVTLLFERRGESAITAKDLSPGDQVIVEGNERLFPGTPLDPRPWEDARNESGTMKPPGS